MEHPHPDKLHIVQCYRRYILHCKKKYGSARSQVHYLDFIKSYLRAKQCLKKTGQI